jgi:hypothetical protein
VCHGHGWCGGISYFSRASSTSSWRHRSQVRAAGPRRLQGPVQLGAARELQSQRAGQERESALSGPPQPHLETTARVIGGPAVVVDLVGVFGPPRPVSLLTLPGEVSSCLTGASGGS